MIFFAKVISTALPGLLPGVDPLDFLAPVCLGLGVCAIALLAELEKSRERARASAMKRRLPAPPSRAVPYRRPPDRES
jgi:hypothetical protein